MTVFRLDPISDCDDVLLLKRDRPTSMLLKGLPSHSFLHSRARLASRNFISTMYLLALLVRISLKWETCSLVCSPMKPRKSDGVMYEGTASMHSVVQSSSLKALFPRSTSSYKPGVSCPSRYRCTTPQPTSVSFKSEGMNLPFVARPPVFEAWEGCLRDFARDWARSVSSAGLMSMLRMDMVSKRQSLWAKLCVRLCAGLFGGLTTGTGLSW